MAYSIGGLFTALLLALLMLIFMDGLMSAMPFIWERVKRPVRFVVSIMPTSLMLYTIYYIVTYH